MTANLQSKQADSAAKDLGWAVCWQQMPHKGAFGVLLLSWLALFHWLGNSTFGYLHTASLFEWLKYCYSMKAEEEHVFLVPPLVFILIWWKREELMAALKRIWWPGVALLAVAVIAHLCGYVVQQTRISFLAFLFGVYALMGIVWGPAWLRAIFFPFFLMVFCMPLGNSAEIITVPLRKLVAMLSVGISHHALGIDVIREGSRIFDASHSIEYDVAPACSGIRSLVALILISTIYGFVAFKSFWRRWLIVVAAFPLAVLGNTMRITTVIIVGKAWGQDAGARIEQNFGFITYLFALGALFAIGYWLREDKAPKAAQRSPVAAEPMRSEVTT
jgi:exosortase